MMRLRISRSAKDELDGTFDYWAERANIELASRMIYSITEHFTLLAGAPDIGRCCDEIAPGVRCFPAEKYPIYYCKARGATRILHIFYGAREQAGAYSGRKPR